MDDSPLVRSATHRMIAARRARDSRVDETLYLLVLLSVTESWRPYLHLCEAKRRDAHVVCAHLPGGKHLTWIVSEADAVEFFGHLQYRACVDVSTRQDKMDRLEHMAREASRHAQHVHPASAIR